MKVLMFGASGMVGQGVLKVCLAAAPVEQVVVVVREPLSNLHPKLKQLVCADLMDAHAWLAAGASVDACFFCLGSSSGGASEAEFARVNRDLPLAVARQLVAVNPGMAFTYVSGVGTDATGSGAVMWARVKGQTENGLLGMGFRSVQLFRPSVIVPLHGEVSKTPLYRWFYRLFGWTLRPLRAWMPLRILDTEQVGLAMLASVAPGRASAVLEPPDIHRLAQASVGVVSKR